MNEKKKERKLSDIRNAMVKALLKACEEFEAPAHIQAQYDNLWDAIRAEVVEKMKDIVLLKEDDTKAES